MGEKISIIIPVYNVQEYLPKCIESVLRQTYRNLEIILVDDGSPDHCGKICDSYAKKDARIRVIHKKNEGVAIARNTGMEYATGEYISFIDSDDWIPKNAYQVLYHGIKQYDADCAVGKCMNIVDKNGALRMKKSAVQPVRCETAAEAMKHVLLSGSAIWNRLFKRKVFHNLRFPADRVNDDEFIALRAYAKCEKIVFLNQGTYYYRLRKNSITTSRFSLRNLDYYYNSKDNLAFIEKEAPGLKECAEYKYIKAMLYCYFHLKMMKQNDKTKKITFELKKDMKKNLPLAQKNQYLPRKYKLLMFGCSICPRV